MPHLNNPDLRQANDLQDPVLNATSDSADAQDEPALSNIEPPNPQALLINIDNTEEFEVKTAPIKWSPSGQYDPEINSGLEIPPYLDVSNEANNAEQEADSILFTLSAHTTTRQRLKEKDLSILDQNKSAINNPKMLLTEQAIVGVKFRDYGHVFYCSAGNMTLAVGDFVMADCDQGLGKIISILQNPPEDLSVLSHEPISGPQGLPENIPPQQQEIPEIIRLADAKDLSTAVENTELANKAKTFCQDCIRNLDLDMKLVDIEIFHDRSKIIFYFTAPARIDFRELVKELVKSYRTRIELRQIGVRHETQMLGGIGNCGTICCCRRYLRHFAPVTIKMAKEQNLFLNPVKISGLCGRLLCCLSYEQENYENFNLICPKIGKRYQTDDGIYKIVRVNMFRTSIIVQPEGFEEKELTIDDWKALNPKRNEQSLALKNEPDEAEEAHSGAAPSPMARVNSNNSNNNTFNGQTFNGQTFNGQTAPSHKPSSAPHATHNSVPNKNIAAHKNEEVKLEVKLIDKLIETKIINNEQSIFGLSPTKKNSH